jgi:hypothetical protein
VQLGKLGISLQQWLQLPRALRQAWWQQTDYGRQEPGPELVQAIATEVARVG